MSADLEPLRWERPSPEVRRWVGEALGGRVVATRRLKGGISAATRVVVVSPQHDTEEFLSIVDRMGLQRVSYAIGWTAWLDISPDGVSKATAMERVRHALDIPRSDVVAVGDGRNDIEMLEWAGAHGIAAAMGQAPDEVKAVAGRVTGTVAEDGLAELLDTL